MFLRIFQNKNDGNGFNEYLATISACIIAFAMGVHIGWTSPAIPKLQSSEYPFEISNEAASYIAISGPIGDIFGEVASTLMVDVIGRKNTIVLLGLPIVASNILIYFSYVSPVLLYVARFLGGITVGTAMSIGSMYTSEIARPKIRGKLGVLPAFTFILGVIAINLIGKYFTIHEAAMIFAVFFLVFLSLFALMPKSPYFLLMKGRVSEAEESLNFLRRTQDVKKELISLTEDVQRQLSERGNYKDLFIINSNKKALFLMIAARMFQQSTGATTFTMYGQDLLDDSKEIIEPQFALLFVYIIQGFMVLLCGRLSDKYGRVPLLTLSHALCVVTLILQGGYFTLRDYSNVTLPPWINIAFYGAYYISFQIGVGSLLNLMSAEIFSVSIKAKATCLVNITYSLTVIATTKLFQVSTDYFHISFCFYLFAISSLIGAFFFKFCFPETKGKTLEGIQMELKGVTRRQSKISLN